MVDREVIVLLRRYIDLLNAEGISVSKAFLFGSYANNTATETSDIDIMIVSNKYDETDDIAASQIWTLTRKINTKIEPFLIGLSKFTNDDVSPLVNYIKQNGVEIN